jgi:hypothetical protein
VRTSDGRDVLLPRSYLESLTQRGGRTLDHAYALTGHKAQGMTTGKAFVLGTDDLYREWGYVAMSRGSIENHLYVVAPRARERDEYAPEENRRDPLEALVASLEYSHAQTAALDVAAREGIGQMTTPELAAEQTRLAGAMDGAAHRPGGGQLERVRAQRAEAERSAAEARRSMENLERGARGAVDAAVETQARERVAELADHEARLAARDASRSSTVDPQILVRYGAIGEELDRRRAARTRAAVLERPEYLVRELGPYPDRRGERRDWYRAARRIETYRQEFGVTDQRRALGAVPSDVHQRPARREAERVVERARRRLVRAPERERTSGRELR